AGSSRARPRSTAVRRFRRSPRGRRTAGPRATRARAPAAGLRSPARCFPRATRLRVRRPAPGGPRSSCPRAYSVAAIWQPEAAKKGSRGGLGASSNANAKTARSRSTLQEGLAAIDPHLRAVDVAGAVAHEERHEVGDLFRFARRLAGQRYRPFGELHGGLHRIDVALFRVVVDF